MSPFVTLTLWGVGPFHVPAAIARMALDRRHVRAAPGLRYAKLLGTGNGRTFTPRDADPLHWGLLAVWETQTAARAFAAGTTQRRWARLAHEQLDVAMLPISSRGRWAGQAPFGDPGTHHGQDLRPPAGPIAALTRARIRPAQVRRFWHAVPPVAHDLRAVAGLRLAIGIGEAPTGLQGTFSLWDSADALTDFAYRRSAHVEVIARTAQENWYAEELFARFEVISVSGTFRGACP